MSTPIASYEPHPLALIFPGMNADEMSGLHDSIQRSGLRESIVLHEGKILDGLNRYRACQAGAGTAHFREFGSNPTDGPSPAHFVADKNLHHRHLSAGQRAAAAEEFIAFFEAEARGKTDAVATVAKQFNVSTTSVKEAKALKKNDPTGFAIVKRGEKSLHKATEDAKAKQAEADRLRALEETETEALKAQRKKHVKQIEKTMGETFALAFGSGILLKTQKEFDAFVALPKEDQKLIGELVIRGWSVDRASKFMIRSLSGEDKLKDLALQTASMGKPVKVAVDGYIITCRKAVEGAD